MVRDPASLAELARQALRDDGVDGRGDQEGFDIHLHQPGDRRRGIVRVERRQHQMAGQRGLDRDDGGLSVADLSDQHDVGVGAKDRSQGAREGQARLGVDLDLVHAGEPVLDRVLDGDDVLRFLVEDVEGRVHRGRLARAGRARHEERPVRLLEGLREALVRVLEEAQILEGQQRVRLVQDPDHDLLSVDGRERGEPEVQGPAAHLHRDPAVLGETLLGDVQVGHHLEPADQPALDVLGGGRHRLVEHTVDPEADPDVALSRFQVDVGGSVAHRLRHDRVHELDDRGVLEGLLEVRRGLVDGFGGDARHRLHLRVHAGELLDRVLDVVRRRDDRLDVPPRDRPDVVERVDVGGIRHRDQQSAVALPDRDRSVPA